MAKALRLIDVSLALRVVFAPVFLFRVFDAVNAVWSAQLIALRANARQVEAFDAQTVVVLNILARWIYTLYVLQKASVASVQFKHLLSAPTFVS